MTQTAKQEHSNFTMTPNILIDGFEGLSDSFRFGYLRFVRLFGKRGFFCGSIRKLGKILKVARMTINRMVAAWVKYGLITEEPGEDADEVFLTLQAENLWQENATFYTVTICDATVTKVDHSVTRRDKGVTKVDHSVTTVSSKSAVIYREDSSKKITEDKSEEHPPYIDGYTGQDTTLTSMNVPDHIDLMGNEGATSNPPHGGPFEVYAPEEDSEPAPGEASYSQHTPQAISGGMHVQNAANGAHLLCDAHVGTLDKHTEAQELDTARAGGTGNVPARVERPDVTMGKENNGYTIPGPLDSDRSNHHSDSMGHDLRVQAPQGVGQLVETDPDMAVVVQAEEAYPLPAPVVTGGKRNGKSNNKDVTQAKPKVPASWGISAEGIALHDAYVAAFGPDGDCKWFLEAADWIAENKGTLADIKFVRDVMVSLGKKVNIETIKNNWWRLSESKPESAIVEAEAPPDPGTWALVNSWGQGVPEWSEEWMKPEKLPTLHEIQARRSA